MITALTREEIDAEDDELLRKIAFNQATNYQYAYTHPTQWPRHWFQAKPAPVTTPLKTNLPCVCGCSRDSHNGGRGHCNNACRCAKYKTTGEVRLKAPPPPVKPLRPSLYECEVKHVPWFQWKTAADTDERKPVDVRWRYGLRCDVPTQESEEGLIAKLIEDEPLDLSFIDGVNYAGLPGFQSRFKKHRVSC